MNKKMSNILIALLISLITATVLSVKPLYAVPTPEIAVINPQNPSNPAAKDGNFNFLINTTSVGFKFNATLWVFDFGTPPVFAWQVKLNYNSALLNATRAWTGATLSDPNYIFHGRTSVNPAPSFSMGSVLIADSLLGGNGVTPPPNPAKLATVEFQIMSAPPAGGKVSTNLDINNGDTYLLDDTLSEVTPILKTSGYYEFSDIILPPPPATIYIDPSKILDPTLTPSHTFNVNVTVANATNVFSFGFKLGYDPTILSVASASLGDFFPPVTPTVNINNLAGYVIFTASLTSPPSRNGSGTLASVMFHVEGLGASVLDLSDTSLADQTGNALPQMTPKDGLFNNVLLAKIYVDPPEIIDVSMKPPKIFSVNIMIDDVEDLYGYEFWLSYNTVMLTTIGVMVHPILNETHFTTNMMVNDTAGQIWIKVTYVPPANPIETFTPQSIVTLTFKVDAIGSSVLDLYNTKLLDSTGTPIPHQETDGFVMTLIRDVAITDVVPSASFVYVGTPVSISVTAKNNGNNMSETFDVSVYWNDTNLLGMQTVISLPPGDQTTLTFLWDTAGFSEGIYEIKGVASFVPDEFDTTNNIFIDSTVQLRLRVVDIGILSVTVDPNVTYADPHWPVNITVVAENKGMDPETFDVSVYWNDTNLIAKQTVTNLAPNTAVTVSFSWDTTSLLVCHKYKISAELPLLPFELNTTDNQMDDGYVKIKLMGDINGDGKVDIIDIATVARAFGSYPSHPRWNPAADLDRNGKVDILDIAMVARNFGKTCPP